MAAAAKKSGRIAAEGMVYATVDEAKKVGVVVEVNAETDFVAKNADFQQFVKDVASVIIEKNPSDVEALLALPFSDTMSVADALRDKILVIGENISIRRFVRYEGDCVAYVHGGGRIGVLVRFEADGQSGWFRGTQGMRQGRCHGRLLLLMQRIWTRALFRGRDGKGKGNPHRADQK